MNKKKPVIAYRRNTIYLNGKYDYIILIGRIADYFPATSEFFLSDYTNNPDLEVTIQDLSKEGFDFYRDYYNV